MDLRCRCKRGFLKRKLMVTVTLVGVSTPKSQLTSKRQKSLEANSQSHKNATTISIEKPTQYITAMATHTYATGDMAPTSATHQSTDKTQTE